MIKVGHFFAGGGGGILASEILGHESVFAIEIDERRCRVLRESGWFPDMHVECADIRNFDPTPWKGRMDCIAAGFPCQDISCAGTGDGIGGKQSGLVWELFRAIDVIRPSIVFLENSPNIRTKGRREIIRAILERGYTWRDGTLAASHVGAGHRRNRWWCLAADAAGLRKLERERRLAERRGWIGGNPASDADVMQGTLQGRRETDNGTVAMAPPDGFVSSADTDQSGWNRWPGKIEEPPGWVEFANSLERAIELGGLSGRDAESIAIAGAYTGAFGWSPPHVGVRRVVDGMADRVDRVKTCGDGQVPLQAAVAWGLLAWTD